MKPIDELKEYLYELFAPVPKLKVWEWAEKNIVLSERSGAKHGNYSTAVTPYIREPLQAYADRSVSDLALCFGTQTAKTTAIMVGTCYREVNDPMNCLWVMPGADLAKSFSKNRWLPMVEACLPLAAERPIQPNGRVNRFLFGYMEQQFNRATVNFVGSNSASQLASRPAGLINLDEVDKFDTADDKEAGALENAEERSKTFPFPLRVKTSTPTTVNGVIWKEFLLGDQRYYHVPCPHCSEVDDEIDGKFYEDLTEEQRRKANTYITFKFTEKTEEFGECGVRWWEKDPEESKTDGEWDFEKVRVNSFYKCQRCGGKIIDAQKPKMVRKGVWVPINPKAQKGRRSYHLSSIYSLLGKECSFYGIATKWLQTKGNLSKRHAFINSTLAETWDDERAVDDSAIFTEDYQPAVFVKGRLTTMGVDVQLNHFWVVVRAFSEDKSGESWLVFAERVETIEEVRMIQELNNVEDHNVLIDMAHNSNQVARWCVEFGWRGAWGSDKQSFTVTEDNGVRTHRAWSKPETRDPQTGTAFASELNQKALFVYWSNDSMKNLLEILRGQNPNLFHVHSNVTSAYQKHMNSETIMIHKNPRTGRFKAVWTQLRKDNHLRDCELMALLRAVQHGLVPTPDRQGMSSLTSPM